MSASWLRGLHGGRTARFALFVVVPLYLAAPAAAVAPESLFRSPDSVVLGSEAGQLWNARSLAGNPATGHVYVSDSNNSRVSEFTAWGAFVKAWGWGVADGEPELQTCGPGASPPTATCQAGIEGDGPGQFRAPRAVAVDAAGDIFVQESTISGVTSRRVQKFSPEGEFLLMFGGEVNKTTLANVCTREDLEDGEECGVGTPGEGDGQFSNVQNVLNRMAHNPLTDTIAVGDFGRIQEFNLDGAFVGKIELEDALGGFADRDVNGLDVDDAGNYYFTLSGEPDVRKLSPGGTLIGPLFAAEQLHGGVAVDAAGNVWVVAYANPNHSGQGHEVIGFDPSGAPIPGAEAGEGFAEPEFGGGAIRRDINGVATNVCPGSEPPGNLYVVRFVQSPFSPPPRSYFNAYGTAPIGCEDPPTAPPEIRSQYATSVDTDAAVLRAEINPRFWPDATYYVQYGTEACPQSGWEGPHCAEHPAPSGPFVTEKSTNSAIATADVLLDNLQPGTTYRYRFVSQSSGGGPVMGEGGGAAEEVDGETVFNETGEAGTFRTVALPSDPPPCPNDAFRNGPGSKLSHCRAYEMVSPVDKNNGDIIVPPATLTPTAPLNQSSVTGAKLTYSSYRAFGDDLDGAPYVNQYLAERGEDGWSTEPISPKRTKLAVDAVTATVGEYKMFSPDLCMAWLRHDSHPPLAPGAVEGFANLYRRGNCDPGKGSFATLTPAEPTTVEPELYYPLEFQGSSADGARSVFATNDNLPVPPPGPTPQPAECLADENRVTCLPRLYEHTAGGGVRFVCILPNGSPAAAGCSAGTAYERLGLGRRSSLDNAVSADGSRTFWSAMPANVTVGPGKIYVRDNKGTIGTADDETIAVSEEAEGLAGTNSSRYWTAARDGSAAVFTTGGGLYRFEVDTETTPPPLATGVLGVLGASEDASHIYFASSEALSGEQANSEGRKAQAGEPNLYLYEDEDSELTFIGTLAEVDLSFDSVIDTINPEPIKRASKVTPSGRHVAFVSSARLTDYDNVSSISGIPTAEVFLYNADSAKLLCVSCAPSRARPQGREVDRVQNGNIHIWAASQLPRRERALYTPRSLTNDGDRLFFESFEALVLRDTNGAKDLYEWKEVASSAAAGEEECNSLGADLYAEEAGGCISLISSGEASADVAFADASLSGDDVFFTTSSSLVPQDDGLVDIYNAKVGGGFPPPAAPKAPCEGESCQSPPAPPRASTPGSSAFVGPGNLSAAAGCAALANRARGLSRRAQRLRANAKRAARANPRRAQRLRRSSVRISKRAKRLSGNAKRCRAARRGRR